MFVFVEVKGFQAWSNKNLRVLGFGVYQEQDTKVWGQGGQWFEGRGVDQSL